MPDVSTSSGGGTTRRWCRVLLPAIVGYPALAAGASNDACEAFAGTTIHWIVPNKAGGGYDAYSRLLQPFIEKELQATIVIENRSEAGGLVAAAAIRDGTLDGKTIGIINASGLLAAGVETDAPDPAADFAILARVVSNRSVVVTGATSGIGSLEDLLQIAEERPIVIGVRDAGSASVFVVPVVASLLGIRFELVPGYVGNTARALAAIRGEVDILIQNFDSLRRFISNGELRPILQVSGGRPGDASDPDEAILRDVPVLGGVGGVALRHAGRTGRSQQEVLRQSEVLDALIDAGRLIVGPASMSQRPRECLEVTLASVLAGADLRASAARADLSLEPADPVSARSDVELAAAAVEEFAPLVEDVIQRARR